MALVFLLSSLAGLADEQAKGTAMIVTYERSGGFVGMNQRLEISGTELRAFDRGQQKATRRFSADESKRLAHLVTEAEKAGTPKSDAGMVDGFTLRVTAGQTHAELNALGVPVGESDGTPWGDLIAYLDGELSKALEGKARPTGIGPDDFLQ